MTRVLIANHTPIHGSGSGTYILALATGLAQRGHEVALLTPPGGAHIPSLRQIRQFTADELVGEFPSYTGHPCSARLYRQMLAKELDDVEDAWRRAFDAVLREWEPTVLHAQHLWLLTTAALTFDVPVVATCHGSEVPYLDEETARRWRFRDARSPDAVISISEFVQHALDRHLTPGTPHVAMLNPYDAKRFHHVPRTAKHGPRIGFVNRLVEYKRGDRFLEIVRSLVDIEPGLQAWIVGDGTERARLEQLSARLGLEGNVRFHGFVPLVTIPDVFRDLDALVMCAPTEPFGLAAIEAAGCGTPVFVPNEGGLGELAAPPHIRSYPFASPAIVTEIADVLAAGETDAQRAERSAYTARRFALDAYLDQLENVYLQAIEDRTEVRR